MDASLGLGAGHPLHPVHSALAPEQSVRLGAPHGNDGFLEATDVALGYGDRFPAEAVARGKPLVHAVQVAGEQRRLVAPGACPEFENSVAVVVRVARKEELMKLGLGRGDLALEPLEIGLRQRNKLGVGLRGQLPSL